MAQFIKGKKILSEEEQYEDVLSLFGAILFIIGLGFSIYYLRGIVPKEWATEYRFLVIFPISVVVGYLCSLLQEQAFLAAGWLYVVAVWTLLGGIVWWLI